MVLLVWPPTEHLLNERDRGQFVPSRRRGMMANGGALRLLKSGIFPAAQLKRE
jgi:hypothetical protein